MTIIPRNQMKYKLSVQCLSMDFILAWTSTLSSHAFAYILSPGTDMAVTFTWGYCEIIIGWTALWEKCTEKIIKWLSIIENDWPSFMHTTKEIKMKVTIHKGLYY